MTIKPTLPLSTESVSLRYTPITERLLQDITRRIVDAFEPEKIILFGSRAYGKPRTHSDIDLLIVMNRLRSQSVLERDRRVAEIARSARTNGLFPVDVIVRSPAELAYRLKIGDPFFRGVMLKGRVLYARPGTRRLFDPKKWRYRMPEPVLVAEWVRKAEGDFVAAEHLLRLRKNPQPAMVCYHCQQCAEKYLKAYLLRHNVPFERTHALEDLNKECAKVDGSFQFIIDWLKLLSPYANETRYPGRAFSATEAREAVATIKQVRKFVRAKLGLRQ